MISCCMVLEIAFLACYLESTALYTRLSAVFNSFFNLFKSLPKKLRSFTADLRERHRSFLGLLELVVLILCFSLVTTVLGFEKSLVFGKVAVFGGPENNSSLIQETLVSAGAVPPVTSSGLSLKNNAILGLAEPISGSSTTTTDILSRHSSNVVMSYTVAENDNLESLAKKFNIDINTIIWANNLNSTNLSSGDHLVILPISGILHEVSSSDSLETIVKAYGIDKERISIINGLMENEVLMPGEKLVIPGATEKQKLSLNSSWPEKDNRLRMPTTGWNWGKLHANNAVDIANSCGTPVFASAPGYIYQAEINGWNNGYGGFLLIKHKNNLETLYAHLSTIFVSSGAFVDQGDLIGAIGNTGKVDGHTGCHLHLEVHGGENPFVK